MKTTLRTVNDIDNVSENFTVPSAHEFRVVNADAETATVTIPVGLPIGYQRLVRKVNTAQGTVSIVSSGGETFTRANLASVEINADGDYWLLEKVTASRWDLLEGFETGSNANGEYFRYADGKQVCTNMISLGSLPDGGRNDVTWNFPIVFSAAPRVQGSPFSNADNAAFVVGGATATSTTKTELWGGNYRSALGFTAADIGISVSPLAIGRWY